MQLCVNVIDCFFDFGENFSLLIALEIYHEFIVYFYFYCLILKNNYEVRKCETVPAKDFCCDFLSEFIRLHIHYS